MIKQVSHPVAGFGAADLALALAVACEVHAPVHVRAPEVATTTLGRRVTTARGRRRTTIARG